MATCITVGSAQYAEDLRHRLGLELSSLRRGGCSVALEESRCGDYTFFSLSTEEQGAGQVRRGLARILADLIARNWQVCLLERTIRQNYRYLDSDERSLILGQARRVLEGSGDGGELLSEALRRGRILQALQDYLEGNGDLLVEGFVTFRLRDYLEELEEVVDQAVDDFLMDREQAEFIRLLRHFVDAQAPRLDLLHVIIRPEGSFQLMDACQNAISDEYLEEFVSEVAAKDVNAEDLLISALITVAPQRLVVHQQPGSGAGEGVDTIRRVFAGRVRMCRGCSICRLSGETAPADAEVKEVKTKKADPTAGLID